MTDQKGIGQVSIEGRWYNLIPLYA